MRLIDTGGYLFRLEQAPQDVLKMVDFVYGSEDVNHGSYPAADFRVGLHFDAPLRRLFKRQVTFRSGTSRPFKPVALDQAYPVLEWGMNWCVASYDHTRLIFHAAVLVKNGKAILFPADPGSGKSTLAATLALRGWQLFSDEMALVDLMDGKVRPVYRPVCLKNESIELMEHWFPDAALTRRFHDTVKGTVAHLRTTERPDFNKLEPAQIVGICFPRYTPDCVLDIETLQASDCFEALLPHSFNYHILGAAGFKACAELVNGSRHFRIRYNDLDEVDGFLRESFLDGDADP